MKMSHSGHGGGPCDIIYVICCMPAPTFPCPRMEAHTPGWVEDHVEAHVIIAGTVLGVPKALTALLSGTAAHTARLLRLPKGFRVLRNTGLHALCGDNGLEGARSLWGLGLRGRTLPIQGAHGTTVSYGC